MHFVEIQYKIGNQNRVSLVNTDKIISINPCFELKYDESTLFKYLSKDELEKIPDNPLITDFPDRVIKNVKYIVECENNFDYEISPEEYKRIKNILLEVK